MPGTGSNRINEFGFYTNYYTLPNFGVFAKKIPYIGRIMQASA